jgi:hypothetical protein
VDFNTADTGTDFPLGNAAIIGQANSFTTGANAELITRVRVRLKKTLLPTGNLTANIYATTAGIIPTGSALATSDALDVTLLTTAYKEYELIFTGANIVSFAAATQYAVTFELAVNDASNYVSVDGAASGTKAGENQADKTGVTWTAAAGEDIWFEVYSSPALYGLPGEIFRGITHEVAGSTGSGTWAGAELVTWSGGTGQQLAVNDNTGSATTRMWIQLLTGAAPTNTQVITGADSGATMTASGTAGSRSLSQPFVGASTGSAIIGSYGLGIETADLTNADKVTDLDQTLRTPPNNVTFSVGGLESGTEDYVLVAPLGYTFAYDGGASTFVLGETLTFTTPSGTAYLSELVDNGTTGRMIVRMISGAIPTNNTSIAGASGTALVNGTVSAYEDVRQLKLATTLSGGSETAVVCTAAIPTDTPATGFIRVKLDTGIFRKVAYTSYTSATFTIGSSDWTGSNTATGGAVEAGNSIFISYIDKLAASSTESFTGVYLTDRSLFIRVRDGNVSSVGPIKTFETTGLLGSAGGSATAIRTSDA